MEDDAPVIVADSVIVTDAPISEPVSEPAPVVVVVESDNGPDDSAIEHEQRITNLENALADVAEVIEEVATDVAITAEIVDEIADEIVATDDEIAEIEPVITESVEQDLTDAHDESVQDDDDTPPMSARRHWWFRSRNEWKNS